MLAWDAVTLTHRLGVALAISAVSEALAVALGLAVAVESVPDVELVVGVGVGLGVVVVLPVLGADELALALGLELALELGLGEVLGVGLLTAGGVGPVEGTLTTSHCEPELLLAARAGAAVKAPIPMAATPVTRSPPARLVAAGRTRMKHIVDVLPVESAERPIRMCGYI
jgi:hypothetical protein